MATDTTDIFPIGYYPFHKDEVFNYQLNRWHSLGLLPYEDIKDIGATINTFSDWVSAMRGLAEQAEEGGRLMHAAFYWRAAEFYTVESGDPDKEYCYGRFSELFCKAVEGDSLERFQIPYDGGTVIPVIKMHAEDVCRGTILLHGGFDSFIEEWYFMMRYLRENGFDVIGFEGPGQGHMLLRQSVPFNYQWERPVKAVLDHFDLDGVTLFGLSMGGWLCLRAAAYEPRIANVIASGHAVDYSRIPPAFARALMMFFIKYFRSYTAKSFQKVAKQGGIKGWQTANLAHITHKDPLEAFEYSLNLNEENMCCSQIYQNVMYLTGRNDHFIPYKMHDWQLELLKNARSVHDRVYEKSEQADHHCQIGNIRLMLDEVVCWIGEMT